MLILLLAYLVSEIHAKEPPQFFSSEKSAPLSKNLSDFFKLNEELPQAVCDDAQVSRPPLLSSEPTEKGSRFSFYQVQADIQESKLLSFLMGDSLSVVASPKVFQFMKEMKIDSSQELNPVFSDRAADLNRLKELKRKVALLVCKAFVSSGELEKLVQNNPHLFLDATPLRDRSMSLKGSLSSMLVRDLDQRFGKFGKAWKVAGWIEPYEMVEMRTKHRIFRRLFHPVTNHFEFVVLMTPQGMPLGYFRNSKKPTKFSFQDISQPSRDLENQRKRLEIYRLMIQFEAYLALQEAKVETSPIRELQETYWRKFQARFSKNNDQAKNENQEDAKLKQVLDLSFFKMLKETRMNDAYVDFVFFGSDMNLHQIYQEYLNQLKMILKK